ncbi:S1 RNA-binding domain-containing protein [Thiomicrorhabdus aquaedulcis]|uniref:CvfB family protein n=1 Tax=Thiomicrorhabdus aquaedulcis TaxID=2211106 RepID=UPI000FD95C03|nr:S1-like domain-containing RNA-binding protein [Thiomicrorhabdus aquaedulcis]
MAELGKLSTLRVVKDVEFGVYLDGGELGEILLPKRYVPANTTKGRPIEVFIHLDSQDRLVATTATPLAYVGDVAFLEVTDVNRTGAFMNWGMPKDLFVPFSEQRVPMEVGRSYCVYLYIDITGRIAASSKLSLYLDETNKEFKAGQAVSLQVASRSDMGYTAVINGTHLGLIHNSDILQPLRMGQKMNGYIKGIRPDHKINLTLQKQGQAARDEDSELILAFLQANNGRSTLTDKSTPEAIFKQYRMSKASYKKALGKLYKAQKINLGKDEITLVQS